MIKLKKLTALMISVLILLSSIGAASAYTADAASESADKNSLNESDLNEQSDALLNNEYPEIFDLRDVDTDGDGIGDTNYVTPVKFQNPWGTCWAFAAIAASETSILYELGIGADEYQLNLSELQISWFGSSHLSEDNEVYPSQAGEGRYSFVNEPMSLGGAIHLAANLFSSGIGPTFEENVPYRGKNGNIKTDTDGTQEYYSADDDWSVDEKYRFTQIFELEESNMLPSPAEFVECEVDGENISQYRYNETATYAIKNELMEGRAVAVSFCADQYLPTKLDAEAKYINTDTWAHYTYENVTANHGVTIVGWDDTYSKENFLSGHQPPEDGAWIVKNSWGAENNEFPDKKNWGIDGYFYLSYYDQSIFTPETFNFDTEHPATEETIIDQYNFLNTGQVNIGKFEEPASMANVFTASQNMSVRAVSTETSEPGTTVTYEVYRLNKNASDPEDGELLTEFEKTYTYGGYHKENLDKSYPIAAGESYSVVVTLRLPDGNYGVLYSIGFNKDSSEQFGSSIYFVAIVNPGESFLFNQNGWIDLCDNIKSLEEFGYVCDNFSIKAYADPEETPELSLTQEIVNPMDVYHIGDIITFHTTVSNNSLFDVNVQLVSSLADLGEKANAEIKAGEIYEFDYEYTVQEADIENGGFVNKLTLSLPNDSDFSTVISELAVNVTEVQDVTDETGATDATEATDTTEVSDVTEATEATNVTDASNIMTSADSKNVTSLNSSSSNSVQTGDSSFVVFAIVILFAAAAVVYFARKKSKI